MKTYKSILTKQGKAIFKRGNIKVMRKGFIEFKAINLKKAENYFCKYLTETLGSSMEYHYKVIEVLKWN